MNCPRCGSPNLQRKGKRLGRQRYRCKECSSSFTEGVEYKEAPSYEPLSKTCSRCNSTNIVRDGKLEDGAQRYLCKSCGLRFSDNSTESLTTSWECPYCGSILSYAGYGKLGQREYKCRNCGKSCSGDLISGKPIKRAYFKETNNSIMCPSCSSLNIRKAGITKDGRQKYICSSCKKHFMTDYKLHPKKVGDKEKIISLIMNGANVRKVGSTFGFSERYIREFIEPYYKNEKITKEQKDLIIRFGYHCRVPINYLAPYIKCSERACRKILKEHKALCPPPTMPL